MTTLPRCAIFMTGECGRCDSDGDIRTSDAHGYMDYWIKCGRCNGTGRRKTPHVRGCFVLETLLGEAQ